MDDLHTFSRCSAPGCDWHIQVRPGFSAARCYEHFGPAVAQYLTTSDGVEILRVRFMPRESDPDFEPAA